MSLIRVLQSVSGLDFSWSPGDLVDLPDEQAAAWADGVRAEPAAPAEPAEPAEPVVVGVSDESNTGDEAATPKARGRKAQEG